MSSQAQPSFRGSLRFGAYEADPRSGELRKHGLGIALEQKPFQALVILLQHANEVVTRDELRTRLWPADIFIDFDNSLNTVIAKARRALNDSAEKPRFIETVGRRGYRFITTVETLPPAPSIDSSSLLEIRPSEETTEPAEARVDGSSGQRASFRFQNLVWIALAVLLLLVPAVSILLRSRNQKLKPPSATVIQSIMVLPLENLSGDPSQEYFADGMTDELITDLAKIGSLRVISRTSAMHYKGARRPLPEIARELNVDAIVEGSVVRSGNRVRLSAQLIDAPADRHIWAESYERDFRDIVPLQSGLARAIAKQIRVELAVREDSLRTTSRPVDPEASPAVRPVDPEAYDDYLKGRYYSQRLTKDDLIKGIGYLEHSIQRDPNYAPAYADLAIAYSAQGWWFGGSPPQEVYPKAKAAALHALTLDQNLAEAHAILGVIYAEYEWNWAAAEKELNHAVQLNPNSAFAHSEYALHLAVTGEAAASVSEINKALELDPLSWTQRSVAATVFDFCRQYERAIQEARWAVAIGPSYPLAHVELASALGAKGLYQEGFAEWLQYLTLSGDGELAKELEAAAKKISGPGDPGQKLGHITLRYFQKKSKTQYVSPFTIAQAYIDLGDNDRAFQWLDKAYQERSTALYTIKVEPYFDRLRSDPRFQDLLRRMNLPAGASKKTLS